MQDYYTKVHQKVIDLFKAKQISKTAFSMYVLLASHSKKFKASTSYLTANGFSMTSVRRATKSLLAIGLLIKHQGKGGRDASKYSILHYDDIANGAQLRVNPTVTKSNGYCDEKIGLLLQKDRATVTKNNSTLLQNVTLIKNNLENKDYNTRVRAFSPPSSNTDWSAKIEASIKRRGLDSQNPPKLERKNPSEYPRPENYFNASELDIRKISDRWCKWLRKCNKNKQDKFTDENVNSEIKKLIREEIKHAEYFDKMLEFVEYSDFWNKVPIDIFTLRDERKNGRILDVIHRQWIQEFPEAIPSDPRPKKLILTYDDWDNVYREEYV